MTAPSVPVVSQPGGNQVVWMTKPEAITGCPPGLEYLTQLDQILVHQVIELVEVVTGFEGQNRYALKNTFGQQVFFALEESDCCQRQCCKGARGFVMHLTDNWGQDVIRVVREFECCVGCCCCVDGKTCAMQVKVESPPGTVVGYMRQTKSCCKINFQLLDPDEKPIFDILGHCCPCQTVCCTADIEFQVVTTQTQERVGTISKQWTGFVQERCTKANNFSVQFPRDLDVTIKAALIGGVFLVDFMFFEPNNS